MASTTTTRPTVFVAAPEPSAPSVRDVIGELLAEGGSRELRWCLQGHVAEALGERDIDAVGRDDVEDLLEELHRAGLPPGRLRAVAGAIRTLFAYATAEGLVEDDPARRLAVPEEDPAPPGRERIVGRVLQLATLAFLVVALVFLLASR